MDVFPLRTNDGKVFAFEIDNLTIGRREVCYVVSRIAGVVVVRRPRLMSWFSEESFCEFVLDGVRYQVEEPFGDNSRYWVGPVDTTWHESTARVLAAFEAYRLPAAYFLLVLLLLGIWSVICIGLVAPLTPSEGYPSVWEWLFFAGLPIGGATSLFVRAKRGVARTLAAIHLSSVGIVFMCLAYVLYVA